MKLKNYLIQFIILFLTFDILPLFFIMKESYSNPPFWILLIVYPTICFTLGFVFGIISGFKAEYILIPLICFIPCGLFFFSSHAVIYGAFFILIYTLGMSLGGLINRSKS